MKTLTILAGAGLLAFFLTRPATAVESFGPLAKKVSVDGREYLVLRLPNGVYTVTSVKNPLVTITFDQERVTNEIGPSAELSQLKKDIHSFPSDIFK